MMGIKGPFKCYVTQWGWGCQLSGKKRYEGTRINVISVTRGWVKFPGKKCYVTLERPPKTRLSMLHQSVSQINKILLNLQFTTL